jgi:hydrogenase maturation factor
LVTQIPQLAGRRNPSGMSMAFWATLDEPAEMLGRLISEMQNACEAVGVPVVTEDTNTRPMVAPVVVTDEAVGNHRRKST